MRNGMVLLGIVGAFVIGATFWLAVYGLVQLNQGPVAPVGPGVAVAPAPAVKPAAQAGTGAASAPASAATTAAPAVKIVATDLKFDLKEVKATVGQPLEVTLENKGALEHDFVVDEPKFRVLAAAGQTAKGSLTPTKAGSQDFYCSIPGHKEAGMVGKLVVEAGAAPAAKPEAAKPEAAKPEAAKPAAAAPASQAAPQPTAQAAPPVKPLPAPQMAPPVNRTTPQLVKVEIETKEVTAMLDDGVAYTFWTFGGTVPGPMVRVREGDTVEVTLKNAIDSKVTHSIDLHAVTGPGGGARVTQVPPGGMGSFSFKAINPGVYVYHCATPMVAHHIANGMYGLIVVEPAQGYSKVDHEYYVMQGDFYLQGAQGEKGLRSFSVEKMLDERPDYVLFNGGVGAVSKENALKAKVGETVRIFFGVGGPNITSSFHIIGEIFDRVYMEGAGEATTNIQTTLVPAGGSAIVEFKVDVPGSYILVDHSLGRLQKGGAGFLEVEGPANPEIFKPIATPGPAR